MAENIQELRQHADALYAAREHAENVRASVELLQRAARDDYGAAWRLGRALFFLGQEATEKERVRAFHRRGAAACARAARLEPRGVEGHFWLGVNLALRARVEPFWRALPLALRARRALQRAVSLDAAYHAAGPLRVLARLEHKLPRPLGGGQRRARAHFEQAIDLAPANTVTRLYFAEMLLEQGQHQSARVQLETLLNAPHDPAWNFESARDRARAKELLLNEKLNMEN
ncbi:MAG TPA: TRAP transporter TatT component family protein [Pyrinomonadaceae bacterium]|jgi:tetratricopeptide (TPR) repeat protein